MTGQLPMTTTTELTKTERAGQLAGNLDALSNQIQEAWLTEGNFTRTIAYGMAVAEMREALTDGVMKAIMKLKGSKLGFKTDENPNNVYPMELVRDAVIDAATLGLQCVGNQFNIIGGNMYVTKEGFTFLLRRLVQEGKLQDMKFVYHPAEITESSTQGTRRDGSMYQKIEREGRVKVDVSCTYQHKPVREQLEFIVRVNNGMSQDAVLGKAERKAKAWLYNFLTDQCLSDGDAEAEAAAPAPMRDVTPQQPARAARGGLTASKPVAVVAEAAPAEAVQMADALPGLEESVAEADEAALNKLSKVLGGVKRRVGDVLLWARRNGMKAPEPGAQRAEMARFARWVLSTEEVRGMMCAEFNINLD